METNTERYNAKLNAICTPEIERLKRVEEVASDVLTALNKVADIDPCGSSRCHLVNAVRRVIDEKMILRPEHKDYLPPVDRYAKYLQTAVKRFDIPKEKARSMFGQFTVEQWEMLLK